QRHHATDPAPRRLARIQQQEGVVSPLLAKLGAPADAIRRQVEAELAKAPKVRGGTGAYGTPRLRAIFERAQQEAERLRDEYVSTEHLLIAVAQERDGAAGRVLAANGVTADALY